MQSLFCGKLVCYTAVFSVVTQREGLRDDTKNGRVADYGKIRSYQNSVYV